MTEFRHVQAELLLPSELRTIMDACPVVYVPLGAYEFHGEHLPIGLDALNAHGVCLAAANRAGGLVLPPLFYGTGGTHTAYPWTIMMHDGTHIRALIVRTLERLEAFGAKTSSSTPSR
jgi:creatinine amidohydrolase